jgi:hypothetical protein
LNRRCLDGLAHSFGVPGAIHFGKPLLDPGKDRARDESTRATVACLELSLGVLEPGSGSGKPQNLARASLPRSVEHTMNSHNRPLFRPIRVAE